MIVECIEMIFMGNLMIVMGMVVVVVSVVIMFWFVVMFLVMKISFAMMLLENILKSHDLVTRECVKEEFTLHFSLSMTHSS